MHVHIPSLDHACLFVTNNPQTRTVPEISYGVVLDSESTTLQTQPSSEEQLAPPPYCHGDKVWATRSPFHTLSTWSLDSRLEWQRQSTVLHRSTCNNLVSELEYLWPMCVAFINMKIKWWFMNWFIDAAVLVQCGLLSSMQVCKSTSLSPIWQTCILSPNSLNVSQLFTSICELPSLA